MTQTLLLNTEEETKALANRLAKQRLRGSLWLSGELGAGKTTFTRYFLQALGHTGAVKSPTFTFVDPYEIMQEGQMVFVYHADLYRLNDPEELEFMGFFEYFDEPNSLVIIEWASRAQEVLPTPDWRIHLKRLDDERREIVITGSQANELVL